jgi:hypothetical protein
VTEAREPIRSYQRIFSPERRIYQVEGRTLPIPGGIPLRWLAYATGTLLAVLALDAGSTAVAAAVATVAGLAGRRVGGRTGAAVAAGAAITVTYIGGWALGLLDWPLRLIVIPAAVATLATQATPDGRRADRFALSWLAIRLAPLRRSLGRALPATGRWHRLGGEVWVAPDERSARLRRARVRGPALLFFATPVGLRLLGRGGRRLRAWAGGEPGTSRLALEAGQVLEVRP